ncbi:hypothetical protein BJ878DRAFT_537017 [Calycina marina]|uniref:Fringe-like glycosyltransferase domain-containing protein n=1 Tax=Calycina marina TaxID=1763456 RepID=A0A9P7YVA3_9HELO|nr:hypothetical protein BJ878DRAFT_537017 [Calycina marina]
MHSPASSIHSGNHFSKPRGPLVRIILITTFCLTIFVLMLRGSTENIPLINRFEPETISPIPMPEPQPNCSIDAARFQDLRGKYFLGERVEYAQRYIKINREDIPRKTLTTVNVNLFPDGFEIIELASPPKYSNCWKPLELAVPISPYPHTVDASDLLFGISTTYKRLYDETIGPIKEWAHWLTDGNGRSNGAGLILRLVDASEEQLDTTHRDLLAIGIDAKVFNTDSSIEMAKRYLSLLPALYHDHEDKPRKWLVMCDDDTFFPSMHRLLAQLGTYNHAADLYIGTLSEDVNNMQRHGSQAFGGAGVFFTTHLAGMVAQNYDSCSTSQKIQEANSGWGPQGDILLRKCVYENTEVRLTMLRDLHQLDITGDAGGFYESGLSPLSLHHFKGGMWHEAQPYEGVKISKVCGEDCFLQRFLFADNFLISNGFSVAYYPGGVTFDVSQMERTFHALPDDMGWNMDMMLGPGRRTLSETGRKVAWELKESIIEDGQIRQTYIRHFNDWRWRESPGGKEMFKLDGIIELIWVS